MKEIRRSILKEIDKNSELVKEKGKTK